MAYLTLLLYLFLEQESYYAPRANAKDLLGRMGLLDASDELLFVEGAPLQHEANLLHLELLIELRSHSLDVVVLRGVKNSQDDPISLSSKNCANLLL